MGGAGGQTRSIMQSGLRLHTGVAVIVVRAVTQGAVGVATQTLPFLFVLKEPLGAVEHAQALVEKVILLAACTKNRFLAPTGRTIEDNTVKLYYNAGYNAEKLSQIPSWYLLRDPCTHLSFCKNIYLHSSR